MEFNANTQILTFARAYLKRIRAAEAKFAADVEEWYNEGDGRLVSEGGKGHRFPYCEHGVSTWVDYDCACWQCESGGQRATREAVVQALATCTTINERYRFVSTIPADMPLPIREPIVMWAIKPYEDLA